ncbi:DUF3515 family protein [Nakamurella aerolata]|uniref:DUF3515 domain-containing protein n=1 Tax=Nakamurella aerolata TaxID=1656892 RepID=A0A849ABQ4_9ACTN|nr:DUF3515 domain-containing protein [Nakamurella aerolata]
MPAEPTDPADRPDSDGAESSARAAAEPETGSPGRRTGKEDSSRRQPPKAGLIAALSLPVVVIIAVIVGGLVWSKQDPAPDTSPVAVGAVEAPAASSKYCTDLMSALPDKLGEDVRREVIGNPQGIAVWGGQEITLRCGLGTPAELTCSSALNRVDNPNGLPGVMWLQVRGQGATSYFAADRPVRIALTLPDGSGTEAIQEISAIVTGVMPSTANADGTLCTGGKLPPVAGA